MLRKSVADKLTHSVFSLFKVRHTDVQNIATLTSTKFQLDSLEKCAEFLSIPLDDANEIMMFTNKNSLATRIVAEIKAYYITLLHARIAAKATRLCLMMMRLPLSTIVSSASEDPTTATPSKNGTRLLKTSLSLQD